jgi:hypothetical protein
MTVVLIDKDVASRLRLRRYTLHKNIPVDVALIIKMEQSQILY